MKDPKVEEIALNRLAVCLSCKVNTTYPQISTLSRCKDCGCVLEAKSRSLKSNCPRNLWPHLKGEDTP